MNKTLVRLSLSCLFLLVACDPPKPVSTDPLKRKYTINEFTGDFSTQSNVTRSCPLERRRGGTAIVNNGETLVIVSCDGRVTTYDAAGELAQLGSLVLLDVPGSAIKRAADVIAARGFGGGGTEVKRVDHFGASRILIVHQTGYDIVDLSDAANPQWVNGAFLLRSEEATSIRSLNKVQIPGNNDDLAYTLEPTNLLPPWLVDGGCGLFDRYAVLALQGYQTAERDSLLTGLVAPNDPLSLGGAVVYDTESGTQIAHLAASQFGPRSCESNTDGVVMFNDEEDTGLYPYNVDIFAQLGFREYFGAVFSRVGEVFGKAIGIGGAALGTVIGNVSGNYETGGASAGTVAGNYAVVGALQINLNENATTIGGTAAYIINDDLEGSCAPSGPVSLLLTSAAATELELLQVTDPLSVADTISASAEAAVEAVKNNASFIAFFSEEGCAGVSGLTGPSGVLEAENAFKSAVETAALLQLFQPIFELTAADATAAVQAAGPDSSILAGALQAQVAADDEIPNPHACRTSGAVDTYLASVKDCALTAYSAYSPADWTGALSALALTPSAGSFASGFGACATPAAITLASDGCYDASFDPTSSVEAGVQAAVQYALFSLYLRFAEIIGEGVGTGVGTAIAGVTLHAVPGPDAATVEPFLGQVAQTAFGSVAGTGSPSGNGRAGVNASFIDDLAELVTLNAAADSVAQSAMLAAYDLTFTSLATNDEVGYPGQLRTMTWDELGARSRTDAEAQNYAAFRALPPSGTDFLNKYTYDLIHPARGAKYVKVYGTRFDGATTQEDASLRGLRSLSYVMATSECFDVNKQWNAPRALADGPMRAGVKADVPTILNPANLQTGGTLTEDLENPDAVLPLYTFNTGTNTWFAGTPPSAEGSGADGFMGPIAELHKIAWDSWIDKDATITDKAAAKAVVSGAAPALNNQIDSAFACSTPEDFANPNFTCMLCQARFTDMLSLKLETRPNSDANAKVSCTVKYGTKRLTVAPSCAHNTLTETARSPGSKPRPEIFTNGATTIDGDAFTVNLAENTLEVTVAGTPVEAEWDCSCEGEVATLQCNGNGEVQCLANIDFQVNVATPAEVPEIYAGVAAYNRVLNQFSQGPFGKMHAVDMSSLVNGQSLSAPTRPPSFAELTPSNDPTQWDVAARLVRKGRAASTVANPVPVDDQFGTSSGELVIQTRLFTNGVDSMVNMPSTRFFLGVEGPEGWDLFDMKDFGPGCETQANPQYDSSCFHNATHFGFNIEPQAKSFLAGVGLTDEQAGALSRNLYLFDQSSLPLVADPFININGGAAVGIDERTILLAEGASMGGQIWIYDVQAVADDLGAPIQVSKETLAPNYHLGSVVADRQNNRVFVVGMKRDSSGTDNDVKIFRITPDIPFTK